jgi:regulatory protein
MPDKDDDLRAKAKASALASLAMREHSVLELQNKLLRKDFPENIVSPLLTELQQQKLLSNKRFAEVYWRQRSGKGFGPTKISYELQQKGVDDHLIRQGLLESEVDFYEVVRQVYEKKYLGKPYQDIKDKAKRQGFLYRRGFSTDYIKSVMD